MNILTVSNLQWANENKTIINCLITTTETGAEVLPFSASPNDTETTGRQLFDDCIAGKYGPIQNYIPVTPQQPVPPSAETNKNTAKLRLEATDWINMPDVYDPNNPSHLLNRQEFIDYRIIVRQYIIVPTEGNINWPDLPKAQWSA
jgi:hypothetical protein